MSLLLLFAGASGIPITLSYADVLPVPDEPVYFDKEDAPVYEPVPGIQE